MAKLDLIGVDDPPEAALRGNESVLAVFLKLRVCVTDLSHLLAVLSVLLSKRSVTKHVPSTAISRWIPPPKLAI
jgi:hypothetical protein